MINSIKDLFLSPYNNKKIGMCEMIGNIYTGCKYKLGSLEMRGAQSSICLWCLHCLVGLKIRCGHWILSQD